MTQRIAGYLRRHHWGILATFIALGGTAYAAAELPPNSVGTNQIQRGAVTLGKIAPGAQATLHRPIGRAGGTLAGSYPNPTFAPPPAPTAAMYNIPLPHEFWGTAIGFSPVTYYRDTGGVVHLAGAAEAFQANVPPASGGPVNDCGVPLGNGEYSPIFILPSGDRPSGHLVFAAESGDANGRVDITPDGWVSCVIGRGDEYVSLDGITFRAGG